MNKKSSDEKDNTARRPGDGSAFIPGFENKPGSDECRGISPEKPIPDLLSDKAKDATNFMRSPEDNLGIVQVDFRPYAGKPGFDFDSLADEQYRVYEWADGSAIRLDNPSKLNVSKSGGHRVYTMDGISHYIPSGWNHLWWKVREGCPHFAF